jgi:hypothetical protein
MAITLLMAVVTASRETEAEPVIIDTDTPGQVMLVLDDGETLAFDVVELRTALD